MIWEDLEGTRKDVTPRIRLRSNQKCNWYSKSTEFKRWISDGRSGTLILIVWSHLPLNSDFQSRNFDKILHWAIVSHLIAEPLSTDSRSHSLPSSLPAAGEVRRHGLENYFSKCKALIILNYCLNLRFQLRLRSKLERFEVEQNHCRTFWH